MTTVTLTTGQSWVALATTATVNVLGSGGAGGAAVSTTGGGGGGGGRRAIKSLTGLSVGRRYYFTDVRASTLKAYFGPDTVVDNALVLAGDGGDASGDTPGVAGSATGNIGTTQYTGGAGGTGEVALGGGGGGGGAAQAAGNATAGNPGDSGAGGTGGTSNGGGGAGLDEGAGHAAVSYGAGGGGGGGSLTTPGTGGAGGAAICTITFTALALIPDVDTETYSEVTVITDTLLDSSEVLTGNAGVVDVSPDTAKAFVGCYLVMSQATGPISVVFKDSADVTLFTLTEGIPTSGIYFLKTLPVPVTPGETIQITGGGPNTILNGQVYWR